MAQRLKIIERHNNGTLCYHTLRETYLHTYVPTLCTYPEYKLCTMYNQSSITIIQYTNMRALRERLLSTILLLVAPCLSCAFVAPGTRSCGRNGSALSAATRRNFIDQSASTVVAASAAVLLPCPAQAKESVPVTRTLVTETFEAIRNELTSPTGVVSTLGKLIDSGSFEEILQYTKESDAYFRKAKLGKARKLLTDKQLKSDSVLMSNAVTFDLIGINRASRPGKENRDEQLKYLEELKADIVKFLDLEKTIEVESED